MRVKRFKAGQSTVEYLLVFSLILTIVIVLIKGAMRTNLERVYNRAVNRVDYMATQNMMYEPD